MKVFRCRMESSSFVGDILWFILAVRVKMHKFLNRLFTFLLEDKGLSQVYEAFARRRLMYAIDIKNRCKSLGFSLVTCRKPAISF